MGLFVRFYLSSPPSFLTRYHRSLSPYIASWFHGFGDDRKKEPRVYLSCFDKIKELMVEINRKVTANAKDQRRSHSVLPSWGDIYRLWDLPSSHFAAPLNP